MKKAIYKNKYQMPNIDSLKQTISQTLSNAPQETAYFRILDLQYAYSQFNLHTDSSAIITSILLAAKWPALTALKQVSMG